MQSDSTPVASKSLARLKVTAQKQLSLLQRADLLAIELWMKRFEIKRVLKSRWARKNQLVTNALIKNYKLEVGVRTIYFRDFLTPAEQQSDWDLINAVVIGAQQIKLAVLVIKSWITNANANNWIVIVHGLSREKMTSIYWAISWLRLGYQVLVYDARGHGDSDSTHSSLGWWEKQDLKRIQDWLIKRFRPHKINFVGWSMGAFTILEFLKINYQRHLHQFALIDGVVDQLSNVLKTYLQLMPNLDWYQHYHIIRYLFLEKYHFDPNQINPGQGLVTIRRLPILFMLNWRDRITLWQLGYRAFKTKIEFERKVTSVRYDWNCGHCNGIYLFYDHYNAAIQRFLTQLNLL